MRIDRREFLSLASLAAAGCCVPRFGRGLRLGCQLWGVKDIWQRNGDLASVFPRLAAMGYEGVQSMSFWDCEPDRLAKALAENGLALADMPVRFDQVEGRRLEETVAFCRRFGVDFVYIPWQQNGGRADWQAFCARLLAAADRLRPYGIRIGYHNHLQEFKPFPNGEAGCPIDVLAADPAVDFELDVGPVAESGQNAVDWLERLAGRVPGLHAKPYGATALGLTGDVQDWPAIVSAARTGGVRWMVVECETRKDTFDDVEASARYLKPLL